MSEYTPMIQQYLQIKEKYNDCFLFFRLGDFYELFFEDADLAAKELEITLTSRMGGKEERIPMCGVPHHSAEQYIKKLIDKGYKVAVCEQVEDPKEAKGVVKREVVRVITPGTIMEENFLAAKENNYILFLGYDNCSYALVGCDLSTGELLGTDLSRFELLLEEINQFQAAEIVMDRAFPEREQEIIAQCHHIAVAYELDTNQVGQLLNLAGVVEKELSNSLERALQLMLHYLTETQKRAIQHLQSFQYYQSNQYLLLDSFSQRNLEITKTIREQGRKGSLLWLLDQTRTAMGGRLIKKWLQRPLRNVRLINQRLDIVSAFIEFSLEREELRSSLEEVYDLERLAARVAFGNVNPRDLWQLKKSLQMIPQIIAQVQVFPLPHLQEASAKLDRCQDLADLLEKALKDDLPISVKEGGIFRSGYHEELDQLQKASRHGTQWITELEVREREQTGIKSLKVGFNRVFGYYIEVTKANIHLLKDSRYERKQTLANAERYITPELKEKEALILDANERSLELEYHLFQELREKVHSYTPRLQQLAQNIAEIDVLSSFAHVSEQNHYVRPLFSEEGTLKVRGGRHPVIEKVLKNQAFIANDLMMDQDSRQILLITGPNMAGKSTYMRQIALIIVLAQAGCFVPAEEAILPLFDQIFTRIGAADDLVGGQSTFMVEMIETKQAITKATAQSLILLDEIGRGTSTYDGMSLAQAVIEYIHDQVQAKTLFSTHYHELTVLEETLDKLINVHVACSEKEGQVIFLHSVLEGKADRSYGIHVAQLAEMPEQVLRRAQEILSSLENSREDGHSINRVLSTVEGQLSFFAQEEVAVASPKKMKEQAKSPISCELLAEQLKFLKEIEELEIATMTPIEALNKLFLIQQQLKNKSM